MPSQLREAVVHGKRATKMSKPYTIIRNKKEHSPTFANPLTDICAGYHYPLTYCESPLCAPPQILQGIYFSRTTFPTNVSFRFEGAAHLPLINP